MNVPDCYENTCEKCKNVFYTSWDKDDVQDIVDPQFCPFCGIKFTTKNGEITEDIKEGE